MEELDLSEDLPMREVVKSKKVSKPVSKKTVDEEE